MTAPAWRFEGLPGADLVPEQPPDPRVSHHFYELLAREDSANAHSRYNALVGRIVSFARAAERAGAR